MPSRRPATRRFSLGLSLCLGFLLAACGARQASAQLQTADPYDPSGAMYRGSTYPGYVNDPAQGYRPIFRPKGGANQMESYYRSLDGGAGDPFGELGNRYDEQFRNYADTVGRNGGLEDDANAKFFRDKKRRDELYYQIQRERDPKRKAELGTELKKLSEQLSRDISARKPKTRAAGSSTPPPAISSRDRADKKNQGATVQTLTAANLPAFATFRSPMPAFEPIASLPPPPRITGEERSKKSASGTTGPPNPLAPAPSLTGSRAPSAVLDRALRSEPRRSPPPIPGVDTPR